MAEGGPVHEQVSVDNHMAPSMDFLVLQCPICLEQLQHPKSLPCLHSFCQECLGSYITKELSGKMASASSFSCPVCRKVIEPLNSSENKENWAGQFPTNNLAIEMTRHLQKTGEPISCKPCEKKGDLYVPAKFWCKVNHTCFCTACKINIHDLFHDECEPENITDVNKPIMIRQKASVTGCGKHEEKLEYYCEDHRILGCNKCIIVEHRKCKVVTSANDFFENLSKNSKIENNLEELRKCVDATEILIKDVDEKLQSMTQDHDSALQSLIDLRKKLNERFDTFQKELTDKLIASFKEEKENLTLSRKKCERLMFAMQNTLTSSNDVTLRDDTVGTICLFLRGQAEVESFKGLLQELRKSSRSTSLRHEYDPDVFGTKTSLTIGRIAVHQQQRRLPTTSYSTPLSGCQLKMTGKVDIKIPSDKFDCSLYGIVLLSGGRIVVADNANKKVKLFTENGDLQCEMESTEKCCDICRIDDNTVAMMLINVKTICIVNVGDTNLTISSKIKIPNVTERCFGVTYNNSFFVGTSASLYRIPKNGGDATKIHTIESQCLHLSSYDPTGHVFASLNDSSPDRVAVTRLSDGTQSVVLNVGIVKGTTGIDVDREGNVYVCGYTSNNIIQMSGDGTNVRELLTSLDGIIRPRAISVWGDTIVITFENRDQGNFVRVCQLFEP